MGAWRFLATPLSLAAFGELARREDFGEVR